MPERCPTCRQVLPRVRREPVAHWERTAGWQLGTLGRPTEWRRSLCGVRGSSAVFTSDLSHVTCRSCQRELARRCGYCGLSRERCERANREQKKCCPDCTHPAAQGSSAEMFPRAVADS